MRLFQKVNLLPNISQFIRNNYIRCEFYGFNYGQCAWIYSIYWMTDFVTRRDNCMHQPIIFDSNCNDSTPLNAIIWTNDGPFYWCIYGLFGFSELTKANQIDYDTRLRLSVASWKKNIGKLHCSCHNRRSSHHIANFASVNSFIIHVIRVLSDIKGRPRVSGINVIP